VVQIHLAEHYGGIVGEIEEAVKEMHANHKRRIERKGKKKSSAC
jgi:hypothetical protein